MRGYKHASAEERSWQEDVSVKYRGADNGCVPLQLWPWVTLVETRQDEVVWSSP